MEQIFNPYLPLTEYVPDGEPHVFDGRVYIYGSHDVPNGIQYCEGHYVTWSAPVDNLKDWRYEGVIYRRNQDPSNQNDQMQLWAPDVTKGPDGRYYLYYCFSFYPEIGVAVSDSPAGPFEFYGHVKYPASILGGKTLQEHMPFDPAVLTDDDGRVYLYYGFAPACEKEMHFPEISEEEISKLPKEKQGIMRLLSTIRFGENGMAVELEPDMITMKTEPKPCIPGGHHTAGTGFEGHGFFEASSIRKVGSKYYFVYSSHKSHELCYAVSDHPIEGYRYGGTIVSNGDIGYQGRENPVNTLGNNHGGMIQIGEDWYIFYHRQTNGTEFSRQGCAEKIQIQEDGSIAQVEITSCGLNGGPLKASGIYPAAIACHLTSKETMKNIDYNAPVMKTQTRIVEHQNSVWVTDVKDGTVLGYKYFDSQEAGEMFVELRGSFNGKITISTDEQAACVIGETNVEISQECWKNVRIPVNAVEEVHALYFTFAGKGTLEVKTILFA
ncbi:MAG: family 43 glycosylhydrolase [Eubacteriales bacterium]|nr:family 43 glycosylhydrolase [Eubacteriales bacterium]